MDHKFGYFISRNIAFYIAISLFWLVFMHLMMSSFNREFFLLASIGSTIAVNNQESGGVLEYLIFKK